MDKDVMDKKFRDVWGRSPASSDYFSLLLQWAEQMERKKANVIIIDHLFNWMHFYAPQLPDRTKKDFAKRVIGYLEAVRKKQRRDLFDEMNAKLGFDAS